MYETSPRKVLRLVSELHVRGFQRLRIAPGLSPSGMFWRCAITPVTNILQTHGAIASNGADALAQYSSGSYFGWEDAARGTTSQLAELFIKRFPKICEDGYGSDWMYAGWYIEMLHLTYPDALPIAYADYWLPRDHLPTFGGKQGIRIPLPPPGEATA